MLATFAKDLHLIEFARDGDIRQVESLIKLVLM